VYSVLPILQPSFGYDVPEASISLTIPSVRNSPLAIDR
jgi:hypothetical protein